VPAILLLLSRGASHGYQLLAQLPDVFPRADGIPDPGAFYRTLRELEQEGAITSTWVTEDAGPAKRVYQLADAGREQLESWILALKREIESIKRFLRAAESRPVKKGTKKA